MENCERLERIEQAVNRIEVILNGNGNIGLKTQVALNTEFRTSTQSIMRGLLTKIISTIIISNILVAGAVWLFMGVK